MGRAGETHSLTHYDFLPSLVLAGIYFHLPTSEIRKKKPRSPLFPLRIGVLRDRGKERNNDGVCEHRKSRSSYVSISAGHWTDFNGGAMHTNLTREGERERRAAALLQWTPPTLETIRVSDTCVTEVYCTIARMEVYFSFSSIEPWTSVSLLSFQCFSCS